jgi:hypothetical protein
VQTGWMGLMPAAVEVSPQALGGLGATCLLGFLLCPYLDSTFYRPLERLSPRQSAGAFTAGFGFLFLYMIFMSLVYAPFLLDWFAGKPVSASLLKGIGIHFIVQLATTMAFHLRASDRRIMISLGSILLAGGIAGLSYLLQKFTNLCPGGAGYRLFMSFYGLVFPAYVWLCMLPAGSRRVPSRREWVVFSLAIVLAAPMYWLAFIENRMVWAIPGVGLVLLARLLIPRNRA